MLRGEVWWVDFDSSLEGEIQKTRLTAISIAFRSFRSRATLRVFTRVKRRST